MTIEVSIITSTDSYVKQLAANNDAPKKQTRILRDSLEATAVKLELYLNLFPEMKFQMLIRQLKTQKLSPVS